MGAAMATTDTPQNQPSVDQFTTPEERAEFVLQQLEQFIRDGRTISEGMNFRQWQEMAKVEIANAIVASQADIIDEEAVTKRLLFTFGASFTTIGFWGGLWAYDQLHYVGAALLCGAAGLFMLGVAVEWRFRKYWKLRQFGVRERTLRRVQDLTKRIKKMESELEKEEKRLEKEFKDKGLKAPEKAPPRSALQRAPASAPFPAPNAPPAPSVVPPSAAQTAGKDLLQALNAKKAG